MPDGVVVLVLVDFVVGAVLLDHGLVLGALSCVQFIVVVSQVDFVFVLAERAQNVEVGFQRLKLLHQFWLLILGARSLCFRGQVPGQLVLIAGLLGRLWLRDNLVKDGFRFLRLVGNILDFLLLRCLKIDRGGLYKIAVEAEDFTGRHLMFIAFQFLDRFGLNLVIVVARCVLAARGALHAGLASVCITLKLEVLRRISTHVQIRGFELGVHLQNVLV